MPLDNDKDHAETKQLVEQINGQLKTFKEQTEASVATLVNSGKDASDKAVVALKEKIDQLEKSIAANAQLLATIGRGVPGLADSLKNEKRQFSIAKVCQALYRTQNPSDHSVAKNHPWEGSEFEKDVIEAAIKTRTSNFASEGQAGGYLIPQEIFDIVPLVYAAIPLLDKLPVTKMTGLVGEIHVPRLQTGMTCYQVGENTEPTLGAVKYSEFIGRPRRSAGLTFQSKTLIFQSSGAAEQAVRENLVMQLSRQVHQMLLKGTGNNYQPKGLTNWSSEFSSMGSEALGTNGGRLTMARALYMKNVLDEANEGSDSPDKYGFLLRPTVKYGLASERFIPYSGASTKGGMSITPMLPFISDDMLKETLGAIATTTQVPNTNVKGTSTSCSPVIFGNWRWFYTMFWQDMALRVSDQAYAGGISAFSQNGMFIIAEQSLDCAVVRGSAFCQYTDAETDITKL